MAHSIIDNKANFLYQDQILRMYAPMNDEELQQILSYKIEKAHIYYNDDSIELQALIILMQNHNVQIEYHMNDKLDNNLIANRVINDTIVNIKYNIAPYTSHCDNNIQAKATFSLYGDIMSLCKAIQLFISLGKGNIAQTKIWNSTFSNHLYQSFFDNIFLVTIFFMIIGLIMLWTSYVNMNQYGVGSQAGFIITTGGIDILVPMLINIILVAKVGIGTTAKIQYMNTQEEILAIRMMNIDVNKFILNPMMCSFMLTSFILTIFAVVSLILGGYIAWILLQQSLYYFFSRCILLITVKQILYISIRSLIIGFVTGIIFCAYGIYGQDRTNMISISSRIIEYCIITNVVLQAILTMIFMQV